MNVPPVISATFADLKHIKSRRSVQLIFEVPSELAQAAIDLLGFPDPAREVWVGIARLRERPAPTSAIPHEEGVQAVKAAAMRCVDPDFQRWLLGAVWTPGADETNEANAAEELRQRLGIASRSEIGHKPAKLRAWRELIAEYQKETRG